VPSALQVVAVSPSHTGWFGVQIGRRHAWLMHFWGDGHGLVDHRSPLALQVIR
jgi:hypothetical protein